MNDKISSLKEKFRLALTSTAKVISDDFDIKDKSSENDKKKDLNLIEIDNLTKPSDFIKLRAETDSAALKKKFSDDFVYRKNLPSNTSSRSLYNIAEKIRFESFLLSFFDDLFNKPMSSEITFAVEVNASLNFSFKLLILSFI